jgi:uncharacterized protein YkwD
MRFKPSILSFILLSLFLQSSFGQGPDPLNTAANISWMKPSEKDMIREINLLRSDPGGYIVYVEEYVGEMMKSPGMIGSGQKTYSLTYKYETINGIEKLVSIDTSWLDAPEDESGAIESLKKGLQSTKPLSILKPDKGIYEAVKKYARDQDQHNWDLVHIDSDGKWPWHRIRENSPSMADGNENIAGRFPEPTVRQIVIQLLIDTGIPGYGHRYNLLDPRWTHIACYDGGLHDGMYRWLQNFGTVSP